MIKGRAKRWAAAVAGSGLLFVAAFAMRPGVAAQAGAPPQVSVAQNANLVANILSNVPVTITCAPRTPNTSMSANVSLEQAVSGRIAYGSILFSMGAPPGQSNGQDFPSGVACDNAGHRFMAGLLANTAGAPFSNGQAIVTVSVTVCTLESDGFTQDDCATTTVGPRLINQVS
jgi:hypothetical protein